MKSKLLFFMLCFFLFQVTKAQTFGIKGGVNFANMTFSASGMDFSPKSIFGIHVGPVAEFELQESLFFNTGILYSLKGYKMKMDFMGETSETSVNFNYLEVPLYFAYKHSLNDATKLFAQAGPYIGYALSGKGKSDGETEKIDFKDDGVKRFDFGVGIGLGLELGPIVPSISYQIGISNLADADEDEGDVKIKNKVFQISVAYMFRK